MRTCYQTNSLKRGIFLILFSYFLSLPVFGSPVINTCEELYKKIDGSKAQLGIGSLPGIFKTGKADAEWRLIPHESIEKVSFEPNAVLIFEHNSNPSKEFTVFGKLERVEIVPDYWILRVTDSRGAVHMIDPESVNVKSIYAGPKILKPDLQRELDKVNKNAAVYIDEARLKPSLCANYKTAVNNPEFNQLKSIVEKNFNSKSFQNPKFNKLFSCVGGVHTAIALQATSLASRIASEPGTWLRDHSSNYVYSIGYMAAMNQCLQTLSPNNRTAFLSATLGASVVGNIWEEVDLHPYIDNKSLPIFNSGGHKVKTDLEDLKAGILGSLTYLVGIKIIESQLGRVNLRQFCR